MKNEKLFFNFPAGRLVFAEKKLANSPARQLINSPTHQLISLSVQ
jgi:hypothetical protein